MLPKISLDQALLKAKSHAKRGEVEEAEKLYQSVLQVFPKNVRAQQGLAALTKPKQNDVTQNPPQEVIDDLLSLYNQGQLAAVVERAQTLTEQYPSAFFVWNILGAANMGLGRTEEAASACKRVSELNPTYADGFNNLGVTLQAQGKLDEAITAYNKALSLKPDFAEAYYNMGNALQEQGKLDEAITAYGKALSLKPDYADAYYNMGVTLKDQGKLDEAIEAYSKALSLKPDYAAAYYNTGVTLQEQGKLDEAITAYNKALSLKPDYAVARAQCLHQLAHICDWSSIEAAGSYVKELGIIGKSVPPFTVLTLEDAPERHRLRSELFVREKFLQKPLPATAKPSQKPECLRIGYFSADFHNHATMHLMAQIFALHDKSRFEILAYSYGPDRQDEMRKKLLGAVDVFHDVREMNDLQIVDLARREKLDIAIDLKGFTQNERLGPFAYGLAPVQISYLGYPGTLGADFIDYIVADAVVIPGDKRPHYSEQIIYLPNTYQPTDNTRIISDKIITRGDMGLPSNGFVFCCFNNSYKISPKEFDIWMRLLGKLESSVLWLLKSNKWAEQNLMREAEARGISSERLVFAERVPQAEHLARQKLADLFLDTFSYNAHTTTSDALWAGLPVVTKLGEGFAARVAGSLLTAIGLPELITQSEEAYEALALALATDPNELAKIKSKLEANRLTQPLFDSAMYTRHLETGYQMAYDRYFTGNSPDAIIVAA
jgi:predicted O-linked N-acetylglucosamine transferase (SPINDLY family)